MSTLKTNTIIPVSGGILSVSGGLSAGDCTANGVSAGTAYFSRGVTIASPLFVSGGATFSASTNFTGNVTALGLAIGQSTAPETGISFEINGPSRHDVRVQPTVAADTTSIVYRDVLMVAQSSGTGWASGATTGALVIVAPKAWSNTMLRLEIDGFDYNTDTGGWAAVVSGYPYAPISSWVTSGLGQYIDGSPPFSQIRLGYHDTLGKLCFILGGSSTTWSYPKVHIKSVMASFGSPTGWGHGWTAYWESNAALPGISAGSVVNCTPRGNTRLRNGNYGIGTTAPASTLDVNGTLNVNSTLTVQNSSNNTLKAAIGSNNVNSLNFIQGSGDYMAIGYNLLHTDTASTWNYVGADRASLLRWHNGGFQFWGTATTGSPNTSASLLHLMTINSAGNVGIGTVTPGASLDVNGTLNVGSFGNSNIMPKPQTTSSTSVGYLVSYSLQGDKVTLPSTPAGAKWFYSIIKIGGVQNAYVTGVANSGTTVYDFDAGNAFGYAMIISLD